jgi:hypothetical protein
MSTVLLFDSEQQDAKSAQQNVAAASAIKR